MAFYGREQALEFVHRRIEFLNDLQRPKSQIRPQFKKLHRLHVPE